MENPRGYVEMERTIVMSTKKELIEAVQKLEMFVEEQKKVIDSRDSEIEDLKKKLDELDKLNIGLQRSIAALDAAHYYDKYMKEREAALDAAHYYDKYMKERELSDDLNRQIRNRESPLKKRILELEDIIVKMQLEKFRGDSK
jgi:septal ring factor EnvC (AmiA/AmiB activator)